MFVGLMAPQAAWADLRTMVIGDVNYYVLNNATATALLQRTTGRHLHTDATRHDQQE
jgi:hypothetical protein